MVGCLVFLAAVGILFRSHVQKKKCLWTENCNFTTADIILPTRRHLISFDINTSNNGGISIKKRLKKIFRSPPLTPLLHITLPHVILRIMYQFLSGGSLEQLRETCALCLPNYPKESWAVNLEKKKKSKKGKKKKNQRT